MNDSGDEFKEQILSIVFSLKTMVEQVTYDVTYQECLNEIFNGEILRIDNNLYLGLYSYLECFYHFQAQLYD
jgi:hypothetical protein